MSHASPLRILLTNDDGIDAPGLKALEKIARALSDDVWIVAPEQEQSGAAHSLTLHVPVRVRKISARKFAVSGTPTDCVLMALKEIIPERESGRQPRTGGNHNETGGKQAAPALSAASWGASPPSTGGNQQRVDLVLSGINRGSNVGDDISYSGTVAGAMEATVLGVRAFALSQLFFDGHPIHWATGAAYAEALIRKALETGWPEGTFVNINFPACAPDKVKGVAVAPQGKRVMSVAIHPRKDPRSRPYYWIGGDRDNAANSDEVDVARLQEGFVTVTPVQMDMTDYPTLKRFNEIFKTLS